MRLPADAAHDFGGIELDRSKPLQFRLDGRKIDGFAGDTVLSAVLAADIDTYGTHGGAPIGLGMRFCPLVSAGRGEPVPMDRMPAQDGLDLSSLGRRNRSPLGAPHSLRHALGGPVEHSWTRATPATTFTADLLVVGGGISGLAAADAAAIAGRSVLLVERMPWLGGDARYFGAVGDEESPETLVKRLIDRLSAHPNVTVLPRTEVLALTGTVALAHQVQVEDGPAGRIVALSASKVLLATGAPQRLGVFSGNRNPGVRTSIEAYHLAKRYGVVSGMSAIVATQSNYGYRLALRLHDAGVGIRRIVDSRVNAQSRFVDFAKASGLTLGSGQVPISASGSPHRGLHIAFANVGMKGVAANLEASQLIVSGGFPPDLSLWMLAGGGAQWRQGRLMAAGIVDNVALAGSAAGYASMQACAASGRSAEAALFGATASAVEDVSIDAVFETPDAPTLHGPSGAGAAYLDAGSSLVRRPGGFAKGKPIATGHALSLGDVAASVELGLIGAADAGAIAEERGAPGDPLVAVDWKPVPVSASDEPAFLSGRFGSEPPRVHLVVDGWRKFEAGALVYPGGMRGEPADAIGVVVESAEPGGIALVAQTALRKARSFVVETMEGPSPARRAS